MDDIFYHGTVLEVETITENSKKKLSKQDIHKAELARALQDTTCYLNAKRLLEIAQKIQLKNIKSYYSLQCKTNEIDHMTKCTRPERC